MFAEHMRGGAKKDKGMLETELVRSRTVLVEKSYRMSWEVRVSAEAGEYESGSWEPSMIIRRATIL